MPDIYVRNFKAIEAADLSFTGVCLVGAQNMAGKSSLAQAVRAALTGEALVLDGSGERLTLKHSAPALVRSGAEKAYALIVADTNKAQIEWPKGEYKTEGERPPASSRIAAGIDSLATMKQSERAGYLTTLLDALPTREHLLEALTAAGVPKADKATDFIWQEIERGGWDHAQKFAADKGAERKGQWREVTGETWGADKGQGWTPAGWHPAWDALTVEDAEAGVTLLDQQLEAFDKTHGRAVANEEGLRAKAAALAEIAAQVLPDTTALGEAVVAAEAARNALPRSADEPEAVHPCPQCHEMLAVAPGETPPWRLPNRSTPTKRQVAELRARINEAQQAFLAAKDALAAAHVAIARHTAELEAARAAAKSLEGAGAATGEAERAALVSSIAGARTSRDLVAKRLRAAALDAAIRNNAKLIAVLAPDGLRQAKVLDALQAFNAKLAEVAGWMGSAAVIVRPDMAIVNRWQGDDNVEPYWLQSASQQFRTRIVLQATTAAYEGAAMIVVDADADMDRKWMKGTLRMLGHLGIPALVMIRCDSLREMPPQPPKNSGVDLTMYWISGGIANPVEQLAEAS